MMKTARYAGMVALLSAAFSAPAVAQGIEFSGGVNFATLSGSAIENAAKNIGMNFGIDFILPAGPIGLGLGFGWAQKGAETADAVANSTLIDLSYIEIPINLRFPLVGAGPVRLNLILGPRIGINTGCEIKADQGALEDCADFAQGFEVSQLDWSATGGLGVGFSLGGLAYMGTELTYVYGLTSVAPDAIADLKNRAFTLQAFLGFDIF
jgi:outer membrane protein with beta-barrel domain